MLLVLLECLTEDEDVIEEDDDEVVEVTHERSDASDA